MRMLLATILFIIGIGLSFLTCTTKCHAYTPGDIVVLGTMVGCSACEYSEELLTKKHIPYRTIDAEGIAPELFVNGKSLGYGTETVEEYIK